MHKTIALIAALGLAPFTAVAQYNAAPGYSMGNALGNGFPNWGGYGTPGMFPFSNGGGQSGIPGATYGGNQSQFMTIPTPQAPNSIPTAPAQMPTLQMTQPSPYWMQTPAGSQPQSRYITEVPSGQQPMQYQQTAPGYSVFAAPSFSQTQAQPSAPPRWAPLPGQALPHVPPPTSGNSWAFSPFVQSGSTYATQAPAPAAAPPKWPTE